MNKRIKFDFEIDFTNGGGIQGQDFRLDIAGDGISDKEIIIEQHKRNPIYVPLDSSYIDLSHVIYDGLITHRGLPAPIICDYLSREASRERYAPGTEFQIGKIEMVMNTGTYVDCPFHRYEDGKDLSEVDLERFVDIDGIVIRADYKKDLAITAEAFKNKEIRNRAVLVHTGWDELWATDAYIGNHPFLTEDAAIYLRDCGVKLVGIDSMNIDDTRGKERPVHSTLLKAEILIAEHLCNLKNVPDENFTFTAAPPKLKGAGTFPVRAFARIKKN